MALRKPSADFGGKKDRQSRASLTWKSEKITSDESKAMTFASLFYQVNYEAFGSGQIGIKIYSRTKVNKVQQNPEITFNNCTSSKLTECKEVRESWLTGQVAILVKGQFFEGTLLS